MRTDLPACDFVYCLFQLDGNCRAGESRRAACKYAKLPDEPVDTPASPWHMVKDELPPPNKTVLVCKIWGDVNGEPHKVITMDSFTISPSDSVIAWMPLPEPPKEE